MIVQLRLKEGGHIEHVVVRHIKKGKTKGIVLQFDSDEIPKGEMCKLLSVISNRLIGSEWPPVETKKAKKVKAL